MESSQAVAVPFSVQLNTALFLVMLVTVRPVGVGQLDVMKVTVLLHSLTPSASQLFITCTMYSVLDCRPVSV